MNAPLRVAPEASSRADAALAAERTVNVDTVLAWQHDGEELAIIDVREEGEFGVGHLLYAINAPYSRLELDLLTRIPRLTTRLVLVDNVPGTKGRATQRLASLGYTDIYTLEGGIARWQDAGQTLFHGVNVPSKAFAELVEHAFNTPGVDPADLAKRQASGENLVVLDCRTEAEFERYHVPGAINAPGVELLRTFDDLVDDPSRTVVVSCAGRTRGIIGAQALINAGIPNPVLHLRGGTQAWRLAGFDLESGASPQVAAVGTATGASGTYAETPLTGSALERTKRLIVQFGLEKISHADLAAWQTDTRRTTFVFDVRTAAEYRKGHLAGSIHAPGGQLVQTTDRWIGTRGARVVLIDDLTQRAALTAHWIKQLGHEVVLLDKPLSQGHLVSGEHAKGSEAHDANNASDTRPPVTATSASTLITPADALKALQEGADGLFFGSSADYLQGHPPGVRWQTRSRIGSDKNVSSSVEFIVAFGSDEALAHLAAIDLAETFPKAKIAVVRGGIDAWRDAHLPLEASQNALREEERIDYLFWAHDRHDGNLAAIAQYLGWEEQLPHQIGDPSQSGYHLLGSNAH